LILGKVLKYRRRQPKVGTRKLHMMLKGDGINIGRDRLFSILRSKRLLIKKKRKYIITTNSRHRFRMYKNLIKSKEIKRPNQVYVGDITYIRTKDGFRYLSLLTDKYSRKIVGYSLNDNLGLEGVKKAFRMAIKGVNTPTKLIHHTDRGLQYCSKSYIDLLKTYGLQISMTEENHVYENAMAERVNGIIKNEFLDGSEYLTAKETKKLIDEVIKIYNEERLHISLNYKTPEEIHIN